MRCGSSGFFAFCHHTVRTQTRPATEPSDPLLAPRRGGAEKGKNWRDDKNELGSALFTSTFPCELQ